MISNLKRYRSDIQMFKNCLDKYHSGRYIGRRLVLYGPLQDPPFYGVNPYFEMRIPIGGNIKASETKDGIVYLGPDLSNVSTALCSFREHSRDDQILRLIRDRYPYYNHDSWEKWVEPSCGISLDSFTKNPEIIKKTIVFSSIEKACDSVESSLSVKVSVLDGQWPKLTDRTLFPMLTLDFNKREVSWQTSSYAYTYRQSVASVTLSPFAKNNERMLASACISDSLYEIEAKCKYGQLR